MAATVLLVDPHSESRDIFATILRHAGYGVVETASGVDGLRLARVAPPNLLICAFPIPVPGFRSLAAAIRADPITSAVPVLAVSSRVFPEDIDDATDDGVTAFLPKPVALDVLVKTVSGLIGPP